MKLRSLLLAAIFAVFSLPASAQTLNWGVGGAGGSGTWDNGTTANWNNGADVVWTAGNLAQFGGTAGTVSIGAAIPGINGMTFTTTGYILSGTNTLTLTANPFNVTGTATISAPLAGTVGLNLQTGSLTLTPTLNTAALTGQFTIASGATLTMNGDAFSASGNATTVSGTLALLTSAGAGTGRYINNLQGTGTLTNASTGTGDVSFRIVQGNFSGNITNGPTAKTAILFDSATAGVITLSGNNTYTGDTLVRNGGILRLNSTTALPTNSRLRFAANGILELNTTTGDFTRPLGTTVGTNTVSFEAGIGGFGAVGGDRTVNIGGAGAALTFAAGTGLLDTAILGFSSATSDSKVTWVNPLNFNAAAHEINVANGTAAVDAELTGAISNGGVYTKSGAGTLVHTAAVNTAGWRFKSGTVTINNGAANTATTFTSIGVANGDNGTLNILGSSSFTQSGDFNISDVLGSRGTLNINTTGVIQINGTAFHGKTSAVGITNMIAGTYNQNGTFIVGQNGTTAGVFNMSGGTINQTAGGEGGAGGLATGNPNAYGYINMTGGTWNIGGPNFQNSGPAFQVGKFGIGVMDQTGGTLTTGSWTDAARHGGSFGLINVFTGATFNQNSTANRLFVGEDGRGYINVFAGGTIFAKGGTTIGNSATGSGILNVLGGTYNTQYITKVAAATEGRLYINGGTLKPTATNGNWINSLNSATIGTAGGTVDTAGFDVTITQVLSGPTGAGITTIPITTGGSGYLGRPIINITGGGGTGATAIANVVGGVVTSITITNPGNDYTSAPTLSLIGGGVGNTGGVAVVAATLGTATFAANPVDGGLIKIGAGVLTLSATNTFTGVLTLSGGTLAVPTVNANGVAGPLGAQATASGLVFNGGALRYTGATDTSTREFVIAGSNTATIDVSTLGANLTFAGNAPTTSNGITKTGVGVLTLAFANTNNYTGLTTAAGGVLAATGSLAGGVAVTTGRLDAGYQTVGTLTVPTLNLTAGSGGGVDFDFDTTPLNDIITIANSGGLTLGSASLNLYQVGGVLPFVTNGTYTLFDYTTSYTGSLAGAFTVANSQPGKVYSIADNTTATTIELTINDAVTTQWISAGGGSWADPLNWSAGVPNSIGATATFGSSIVAPSTVTIDGGKTVGNLLFDNFNSYTIEGADTLTINNGIGVPAITVLSGSHAVNTPVSFVSPTNITVPANSTLTLGGNLSGPTYTKFGTGTLVLGGANATSGSLLVTAGTIEAASAGAFGGLPNMTLRNSTFLRSSFAGTVPFNGPIVFDLNGAAAAGISGAADANGNFNVDVVAGSTLTVMGLFNNLGGSLAKKGGGELVINGTGANVIANVGGIGSAIQGGTITLNGGAGATYAVTGGEFTIGDNTPNAATLNVQSGTLNVGTFLSVSRGNGTSGLVSTVNVTGSANINVPNFFTGFANGVTGYSATSVINLGGTGTTNVSATNRWAESTGNRTIATLSGSHTLFVTGDAQIGWNGVGQATVGAGSTYNANQVIVGGATGGSGVLINRGTLIVRGGASTNNFPLGNAGSAWGYYMHDSATGTTAQEMGVGGAGGGSGFLEVRSGTFTLAQFLVMNRSDPANATSAQVLVQGGTLVPPNIANRFYIGQTNTAGRFGVIDVGTGGVIAGGANSNINLNNPANVGNVGILSIHSGGIVATNSVFAGQADGTTSLNFDNGTLRATAAGTIIGANIDTVTVFPGGATIDTNGFNTVINAPLLAPAGSGIESITVASGGAGYMARPIVRITDLLGSGSGATAVATINELTGELTGITITSPGNNYLQPEVTLIGGGFVTAAAPNAPTINTIATTGGLIKTGTGTLTLSNGGSTYGGNTTVTGGTLLVTNTTGSATGTGNVSIGATATLAGNGIITGAVTTASGTQIVPGNAGVGILTLGGLTLSAGSIINQQITDAVTLDQITITVADGLTINGGGYNLLQTGNNNPYSTNGVYNLIGYTGSILGTGTSALSVLNPQPGKDYAFGSNGSFVTLTISTAGGVPNFWAVDNDGNWTLGSNWSLGTAPNGIAAFANFDSVITAPRTVTLNANQTVGSLAFNNANSYTIAGTNTLTLNNGADPNAQITVTQGSHFIAVPINVISASTQINVLNAVDSLEMSGAITGTTNISKLGAGVLTLSGTNGYVGTTTVSNGTLAAVGTASLGSTTAVNLSSGTTFRPTGATMSVTAPVNMLIGGSTAIGIAATPDAPANYIIDTPASTVATISSLVTNASGSFVKNGLGTLRLTNPGANTLANVGGTAMSVRNGTLVLNSTGSFTVTGELAIGDATPNADVTLTLQDGTLNVSSFISVGRGTGTTGLVQTLNLQGGTLNVANLYTGFDAGVSSYNAQPNIVVANAAVVRTTTATRLAESAGSFSTMTISGTADVDTSGNTQIGWAGTAVVNLGGNAIMSTGGLWVGAGSNAGGNTGAGALNQTGGTFTEHGGGDGDWRIGGYNANDVNVYGSVVLSGGTFTSNGRNIQIGAFGNGIMEVRGGSYTSTGNFPVIGRFVGSDGVLNVVSGTWTKANTGNLVIVGEAGNGVVNIVGGSMVVNSAPGGAGAGGGTGGIRLGHDGTNPGSGTINITGGSLTTTGIAKTQALGVGRVYISGGTIIANGANPTFLQGLDNAVIGPGGATFNTNGNNITINQLLDGAIGDGVVTIPVIDGGSGYIGAPLVQIGGSFSTPAYAIANMLNGAVQSITITNPGTNASGVSVTLVGGGTLTPATLDVPVLSPFTTFGGLTKTGMGTLTLSAANNYSGPTAVNAGTLAVTNTSGSGTGTGTVAVSTGGTLRGSGIVAGAVTINSTGSLRGGNGGGANVLTLDTGLTIASGGRLYTEALSGAVNAPFNTGGSSDSTTAPTTNNLVAILSGGASLNSGMLVTVDGTGATFNTGDYSYVVATGAGDQSSLNITGGQFTFVGMSPTPTSYSLTGNTSGNVFLNLSFVPVPEPGLLLLAGGLWLLRRRSK